MDIFERFTDRAKKVMTLANQEAQKLNHEYVGTEHLLIGLVSAGNGVGCQVINSLGTISTIEAIKDKVAKLVKLGPDMVAMGKLPLTPRAKRVIEYTIENARVMDHNYVGTEHILLGLMDDIEGVACQVMIEQGFSKEKIQAETFKILGVKKVGYTGVKKVTNMPTSEPPEKKGSCHSCNKSSFCIVYLQIEEMSLVQPDLFESSYETKTKIYRMLAQNCKRYRIGSDNE